MPEIHKGYTIEYENCSGDKDIIKYLCRFLQDERFDDVMRFCEGWGTQDIKFWAEGTHDPYEHLFVINYTKTLEDFPEKKHSWSQKSPLSSKLIITLFVDNLIEAWHMIVQLRLVDYSGDEVANLVTEMVRCGLYDDRRGYALPPEFKHIPDDYRKSSLDEFIVLAKHLVVTRLDRTAQDARKSL